MSKSVAEEKAALRAIWNMRPQYKPKTAAHWETHIRLAQASGREIRAEALRQLQSEEG